MSRRRAPIHYRHLRRIYVAILHATHDGNWNEAERLFKSMPMQYQALAHLCVWQHQLCWHAGVM
jgi:hypothetical protein